MTEEPEKIELSLERKKELLNFGLETAAEGRQDEEYKADTLYDVLNRPLPVDSRAINSLPAPLRGLSRSVRSIAGAPLVELLMGSDTDISAIKAIKEYAKHSGRSADSEDRTEVFLSVYYAAIASGLVFHGTKITEHSYEHLAEAFGSLAGKDWISDETRNLFSKAREYCAEKTQAGRLDIS